MSEEFSYKSREAALQKFAKEEFDILIIGGGITGAATARDAASRGLKVALVEKNDFAFGTSSRSSKLIHGGLRYLENREWHLVFESLKEKTLLLKTVPFLVKPIRFYMPVYKGDLHGKGLLGLGLWLYDILSLFRSPGFHKNLSRDQFLREIPALKEEGLQGGFQYYDASMWDDRLVLEILRDAHRMGAAVASYAEATTPIWKEERICGFKIRDLEGKGFPEISLRAKKVIVCAGPWTDKVGMLLSSDWKTWLKPSKGIHLVFDLKKIPVPGALVMSHPDDGRISFVIPRPDYGTGVALVGTTDGITPIDPGKASVTESDVDYLMQLLRRYFPILHLTTADIISTYVGVRPLMAPLGENGRSLQKVSREHHIAHGPGRTVVVAGGKYTTHRPMAREIVDFAVASWRSSAAVGMCEPPPSLKKSGTKSVINRWFMPAGVKECQARAQVRGWKIPSELMEIYGGEAFEIAEIYHAGEDKREDPPGFPWLASQLRFAVRNSMVLHLEDFYLRRLPLFLSRQDHGLPWAEALSRVWAEEMGRDEKDAQREVEHLKEECERRMMWKKQL